MFTDLVPAVYQNAMEYYAFLKQQQLNKNYPRELLRVHPVLNRLIKHMTWESQPGSKYNIIRSQYFQVLYVISLKYKS